MKIFHLSGETTVFVYDNGLTKIEAFITPHGTTYGYAHLGLDVEDIAAIFTKCAEHRIEAFTVPRGDKQLSFVRDPAGNLYELSEKKR